MPIIVSVAKLSDDDKAKFNKTQQQTAEVESNCYKVDRLNKSAKEQ